MSVNLKKASTCYLIGNLFNKGMAFLTVPVFTRILSTADYGIVTTYNSWVAILSVVIGFAIYMGIRAAFIDYEEVIDDFVAVSTTFTLICGAIICLFVGLGLVLLQINISYTLIMLCVLQGLSSALIQNYSMYLVMKYKYKFRTVLMVMPNLISVILSVVAILFIVKTDMYMGRIVPTALTFITFGGILVLLVYKKSHVIYKKEYLAYALKISVPLVIHGIALNILSQSDRTMITVLSGASQTGIYSLIYNFTMIATVITTSLDGVWVPWFTGKLKNRKIDEINALAVSYIKLMTCAIICVVLVGPEVVKLLASKQYWEGINIIPPLVIANYFIFAYTLYVNIEHFHKKTVYITINTLIAAVANFVLNLLLIPKWGYVAAAYTTLFAYILSFLLHALYANKLEKEVYPLRYFVIPISQIVIAVLIFYLFIDNFLVRWSITVLYLFYMIWRNRASIWGYIKR